MSKADKNFRKKPQVIFDIQVEQGLDALKTLEEEVAGWCTYDCYYCDCGIPCPEIGNPCHDNLIDMVNKLQAYLNKDAEEAIEDYLSENHLQD
jgi:hypothetical protein